MKILSDLIQIESDSTPRNLAIPHLKNRKGWYDPKIFETVSSYLLSCETSGASEPASTILVTAGELQAGQVLKSDIETLKGDLLLSAGQRLSLVNVNRLRNYAKLTGIKEPIQVEISTTKK